MLEPYVETLEIIKETPTPVVAKEPRMTNRQLDFLRNLKKHPNSLPLMTWPRATTLRKWMRRPRFAAAIKGLEEAFQVEARLVMAGAAASAATLLQATLTGGSKEVSGSGMSPHELELYRRPLKQLLGVLWSEMARREQFRKAGIQKQLLERMGEAGSPRPAPKKDVADDVERTSDYVI